LVSIRKGREPKRGREALFKKISGRDRERGRGGKGTFVEKGKLKLGYKKIGSDSITNIYR